MNLFKKLFGSKDTQTPEAAQTPVDIKPAIEEKIPELTIPADKPTEIKYDVELSSVSKIAGLDNEFIDLIYFANAENKTAHCDSINKALSKLKIKIGADFHKVHEKLIDYNNDLDEPTPFFIESLLVENYNVRKDNSEIIDTKSDRAVNGLGKIQSYFSAASFISDNINLKMKSNYADFAFEENLFRSYVLNSDQNNFAKLNSLFYLGLAFFKSNDLHKAEYYFNLIENGSFDLQASTLSTFHRNIGELYIDIGDNVKALKWLTSGLTLNPKLGVKKLITKLEADK